MMKKLRYYARFIVVCLLLKKMKLVRDLVRELSKHIGQWSVCMKEKSAEYFTHVRSNKSVPPRMNVQFKCILNM